MNFNQNRKMNSMIYLFIMIYLYKDSVNDDWRKFRFLNIFQR